MSRNQKVETQQELNNENDVGEKHYDAITFHFINNDLFHCVRTAFRKESICKVFWRRGQKLLKP